MKSVISDNKIIPFLPCYKRTSQLHETKVSDLKTVYGCNGYAVYDYIENEIFRTGNHSLYWCKNMLCRVADYWALSPEVSIHTPTQGVTLYLITYYKSANLIHCYANHHYYSTS